MNRYISLQKKLLKFFPWVPAKKCFFVKKYINDRSIDAVFDGDYESGVIFGENIYIKNENRKIRVHFVM